MRARTANTQSFGSRTCGVANEWYSTDGGFTSDRMASDHPKASRSTLGEGIGLFDELVALPLAVFFDHGFGLGLGFGLAFDQIRVGGEVLEGFAFEVGDGFEVVFRHEG